MFEVTQTYQNTGGRNGERKKTASGTEKSQCDRRHVDHCWFVIGGVWAAKDKINGSDKAKVGFTIEKYFSLEIKKGDNVEFGKLDPQKETYTKKNGTTLNVTSNTNWTLSTDKEVTQEPNDASEKDVLNALTIELETKSGTGDNNNVKVNYTLSDLDRLPSGDYVVEVMFTGSTK